MSREFIMQMRPWIGDEERKAINEYMQTDGFLTEFKLTEEPDGKLRFFKFIVIASMVICRICSEKRRLSTANSAAAIKWILSAPFPPPAPSSPS